MFDNNLDILYGLLYNQLIRYKNCPTYVEKKILEEHLNNIKDYLFSCLTPLKNIISNTYKNEVDSYLTWDKEYYKNEYTKKQKIIEDFENKIKKTESDTFLQEDFSKTNSILDSLYPDVLPESMTRKILYDLWVKHK